jgi:hypothetical protein
MSRSGRKGVFVGLFLLLLGFAGTALAADEPSRDLAAALTGWWEGSAGPENHVKVIIQPSGASSDYEYHFDVTIQGRYERTNVSLSGQLVLFREGKTSRLRWIGPRSDCDLPLGRAGDGFAGETLAGACATAFQNPVRGKWTFEIEPGSFAVRSAETGETLRFRKSRGR